MLVSMFRSSAGSDYTLGREASNKNLLRYYYDANKEIFGWYVANNSNIMFDEYQQQIAKELQKVQCRLVKV